MDGRQWLDSLRDEFARRKLSPKYAERMISELTDHFHDFMEDQMSKDARDSKELDRESLERELGSPADIGAAAAEQYRRQRFAGRHPLFVLGFSIP